jgi:hypothetical protein
VVSGFQRSFGCDWRPKEASIAVWAFSWGLGYFWGFLGIRPFVFNMEIVKTPENKKNADIKQFPQAYPLIWCWLLILGIPLGYP